MAKITQNNTKEINSLTTNIAVILSKVDYIEKGFNALSEKLEKNYVTKEEFLPTKNNVNLIITTILVAVIGGALALVLK